MELYTSDLLKYEIIKCMVIILFVSSYDTSTVLAETRPFLNPQMCTKNYTVNDCSHQFPNSRNSCMIYKTEACRNNKFLPWDSPPVNKLTQEENLDFTITILPYNFNAYGKQNENSEGVFSAVNILLTSFNKNINGYSIIMTDDLRARNVCRIIDFRNVKKKFDIPFTFVFDCFQKLREDTWKDVTLSFRAYPLNIELSFYVYIPSISNSTSICAWEPLVMVFKGSLPKRHIQIRFSNVPNNKKFLGFTVSLTDPSDMVVDSRKIHSTVKNDMISADFYPVEGGFYSISIDLYLDNESCSVYRSSSFFVGPEPKDLSPVLLTILLLTTVLCGFGVLYFARLLYLKSVLPPEPTLLFVYFHKQPEHDFLVTYAEYLKKHFRVNVYTLYKNGVNAREWLDKIFSESEIIVYILSEGLFKSFENKDTSIIPDSCYIEQFSEAKALIENSPLGSKKICSVCFPYSGVQHLPKSLKKEKLFVLLHEQENFLEFIFQFSKKYHLLNMLCFIKYHKRFNSNGIKEDYVQLTDELKNITENHDLCRNGKINKDRRQETAKRDLNHTPTEILLVSDLENDIKDSVLGEIEKQSIESPLLKDSSYVKDNSNSEFESEYVQTAENEDDSHLRNELIMSCMKKIVNCEKY